MIRKESKKGIYARALLLSEVNLEPDLGTKVFIFFEGERNNNRFLLKSQVNLKTGGGDSRLKYIIALHRDTIEMYLPSSPYTSDNPTITCYFPFSVDFPRTN